VSSPRWDRLAEALHAAGHVVEVHELPRGSVDVVNRANYGATVRAGDFRVEIRDTWWPKNDAIWTGYQAWLDGPDGLVVREMPRAPRRADVVAFVTECAQLWAPAVTR